MNKSYLDYIKHVNIAFKSIVNELKKSFIPNNLNIVLGMCLFTGGQILPWVLQKKGMVNILVRDGVEGGIWEEFCLILPV